MMEESQVNIPIQSLSGIGPKKNVLFHQLGIYSVLDLFYSFPKGYENRTNVKKISEILDGEAVLTKGCIFSKSSKTSQRGRKKILNMLIKDDTGFMEVTFFNSDFMDKSMRLHEEFVFCGKALVKNGRVAMIHPECIKGDIAHCKGIFPLYALTKGLLQSQRRKAMKEAWHYLCLFHEYLPKDVIDKNKLCDISYALENIHFPKDQRKLKVAQYRLIFEEFLLLQLGLLFLRNNMNLTYGGIAFDQTKEITPLIDKLPFRLTSAQNRSLDEILEGMCCPKIMNRLVQGDVGSGKTVVAAAAIYKAVICGYQAVLMAPTEILAKQHLQTMKDLLKDTSIEIGFLSSGVCAKEKRETLARLESGEIHFIIGTHALIQPNVAFHKLGLVITDEQHRFGVGQRITLSSKGENPDILVMTATPIPRTLALILYGDLDISIIDEMPPGRKKIKTTSCNEKARGKAYDFVLEEVKKGRQAYVVAPLIEESDTLELRSVESLYEELQGTFASFCVGLLHGNMKQTQKDEMMDLFVQGKINVLVATVVIEVGINVPNATVMVIENAERFGLAQMHQLRGRVGRGDPQSYCILISEQKTSVSKERTKVMCESSDGFVIAEKDLSLRGPGEFFGVRQHGIPELKIANLLKHMHILKTAQEEAKRILNTDPLLRKPENQPMRKQVEKIFHQDQNIGL